MCYSVLSRSGTVQNAFSYVSANRKPINLAARDQADLMAWIGTIQIIIAKLKAKAPSEELQCIRREGWLLKEEPRSRQWRRRYFVLEGADLNYFELGFKGTVPLGEGASVHATKQVQATLSTSDR